MPARARVLRGVAVGRAVAAQGGATLLASAQMHPLRAHFHALGALPLFGVPHRCDRADLGSGSVGAHRPLPYSANTWCAAALALDPSPTADATRSTPPAPPAPN